MAPALGQVTLSGDDAAFMLSNGLISAKISRRAAEVLSLRYKDLELLGAGGGRSNGYWSLPGTTLGFGSKPVCAAAENTPDRATVACMFPYDGGDHSAPADVEFRYSLLRGDASLYLQARWHHRPEYPRLSFPVGRFAVKLNDDIFDWMTIDARRNLKMLTAYDWNHGAVANMKEARLIRTGVMKGQVEHKYDYAAVQFETPAYGWSSTGQRVGVWLINPSHEYMSGGPTKLELSAHRDATFMDSLTAPAPPTLLNVWKGPHYGGTSLVTARGEDWRKTIGPFLLYCNAGPSPEAMWKDALAKAAAASARWPYPWAGAEPRGAVAGRIILRDPLIAGLRGLLVGLSHADYTVNGESIGWQRDGKYYQYWVRAGADGSFRIAHVRPGSYTLHAFAQNVLGEYARPDVRVAAGETADLGMLSWAPERHGTQLWEIGVPDRTAGEFLHGDHYWQWGLYNRYPEDFPDDVHYVVGRSDSRKDWNLMQVPHAGKPTTWTIRFDMPHAPRGRATLRLSFAGADTRSLTVTVNGREIAAIRDLPNTGVIRRDAIRGYWFERKVGFDAALMKEGANEIALTVPAGNAMAGVEYDYLRLELRENPE